MREGLKPVHRMSGAEIGAGLGFAVLLSALLYTASDIANKDHEEELRQMRTKGTLVRYLCLRDIKESRYFPIDTAYFKNMYSISLDSVDIELKQFEAKSDYQNIMHKHWEDEYSRGINKFTFIFPEKNPYSFSR